MQLFIFICLFFRLIKLASPVPIDNLIIPACLPADNRYTFEGLNATVLGWGEYFLNKLLYCICGHL